MKKIILLISVVCIAISFTACNKTGKSADATKEPLTEATAVPTDAPKSTAQPTPMTEPTPNEGQFDISKYSNIAMNKPVTENGHEYESTSWNKNFLTDGIKMEDDIDGSTNGWMSEAAELIDDETWVYVDLEESHTIQAVAVYPRESEMFFPAAYEIQLSMDADKWTTVKTVQDDHGELDVDRVFVIEPSEARYVRILVKERYDTLPGFNINGYIAELSEIEVYA